MGRAPSAPCWLWLVPTVLELGHRAQPEYSWRFRSDHATRATANNNNDNNYNQQSLLKVPISFGWAGPMRNYD